MNLNILLVEDSALDQRLFIQAFADAEGEHEITAVPRAEESYSLIANQSFDVLVTDQNLPGQNGLDLCQQLLADEVRLPLVILTGAMTHEVTLAALKLGVDDFVIKDGSGSYLDILPLKLPAIVQRYRDRQARLEAEQALRAYSAELKEQNEDLDAFAYMVAHDIVSPLSVLKGYVDTLQLGYGAEVDETTAMILGNIATSTNKVINIVEALLMLVNARRNDVEMKPLAMAEILQEAFGRLESAEKGAITVAEQWPLALGFAPWVEEVWVNYLTNALKYGGDPAGVSVGAVAEAQHIRFYVRDQGPGLDEEEQLMVFHPFQRLEPGKSGHGLGLTIVQRLVEKMGGKVGVDSQPGAGSEFYFTLPCA